MQFRYLPDGAPEDKAQLWDFEPGKMTNAEAESIEDLTGWTFAEWEDRLYRGAMKAQHALLFTMLRRDRKLLKYREVVFTSSEVGIVLSDEELALIEERADRLAEGIDLDLVEEPDPAEPDDGDGDQGDSGAAERPFSVVVDPDNPEGETGT